MLQFAANALVLAGLYAILAAGYVLVFRASRLLNFAHGDLMVLGGYLLFSMAVMVGNELTAGAVLAMLVLLAVAALSYQLMIRPMVGHPVFSGILVTIGLSIVLRTGMVLTWTQTPLNVGTKLGVADTAFVLPVGVLITITDVLLVAFAITYILCIHLFLKFSRPGAQMRAAAESPVLAALSGVNVYSVLAIAWLIAAVGAAFAGMLFGVRSSLVPDIAHIGLKAIPVATVGGMDRLGGVIPGALIVALAETAAITWLNPAISEAVPMVILMIVLIVRPWGLIGTKQEFEKV